MDDVWDQRMPVTNDCDVEDKDLSWGGDLGICTELYIPQCAVGFI